MQVKLIVDLGGDRCGIVGEHDGQPVVCMNWTSATWNYYPPEAYNPETGHRYDPNAPGRQMTDAEMEAWALVLLDEQGIPAYGSSAVLYQAP